MKKQDTKRYEHVKNFRHKGQHYILFIAGQNCNKDTKTWVGSRNSSEWLFLGKGGRE